MEVDQSSSPEEFQEALFTLINNLFSADGLRFSIYLAEPNLSHRVGSDDNVNHMISEYDSKHWDSDPMHPSNFEGSDIRVVTNTHVMINER